MQDRQGGQPARQRRAGQKQPQRQGRPGDSESAGPTFEIPAFVTGLKETAERILPASVPLGVAATVAGVWLLLLLLWGTGAVSSWALAAFLAALAGGIAGTGVVIAQVARGKTLLRAARAAVVTCALFIVPLVFDPHSGHVFNLPKYTVIVWSALVLAALWVVDLVYSRRLPRWRNGMHWLLLASPLWVLVTAITSTDTRLSVLGLAGSYDGLYSALAFMVIAFTAAEAFEPGDLLKVLGVLGFAAGTVEALYGVVQIHDLIIHHAAHWDFVKWATLPFHNVFSTMGNPNFLSAVFVMALPACVLITLRATRRWVQVLAGFIILVMVAEVIQTATRGAWVAAIIEVPVLGLALWPELKKHWAVVSGAVAAGLIVIVGGLAAGGTRYIGGKLSGLFASGKQTSVNQRFELWKASYHMAINHPVVGIGPDAFEKVFPRYETAAWANTLGKTFVANGAHGILFNTLADRGFVGLAVLLAVILYAAVRWLGSLRRYLVAERAALPAAGGTGPAVPGSGVTDRCVVLAVVGAGFVAEVVQNIFNTQEVALSMLFWLFLGLLCVAAAGAGVPSTWSWRRILGWPRGTDAETEAGAEAGDGGAAPRCPACSSPVRRGAALCLKCGSCLDGEPSGGVSAAPRGVAARKYRAGSAQRAGDPVLAALAGAVCAALVVVLGFGADGPWRAAHDYWAAVVTQKEYANLSRALGPSASKKSTQVSALGSQYFADLHKAMAEDPWNGTYASAEGVNFAQVAVGLNKQKASTSQQVTALDQARTYLDKAVQADPLSSSDRYQLAQVLIDLGHLQPSQGTRDFARAVAELRTAMYWNPRNSGIKQELLTAEASTTGHSPTAGSTHAHVNK